MASVMRSSKERIDAEAATFSSGSALCESYCHVCTRVIYLNTLACNAYVSIEKLITISDTGREVLRIRREKILCVRDGEPKTLGGLTIMKYGTCVLDASH